MRRRASTARTVRIAAVAIGLAAAAVIALAVTVAGDTGASKDTHRAAVSGGFSHGRIRTWRAAIETAGDRPLAGSGADSFLAASVVHQRSSPVRFAHDLPLELAAELGVAGLGLAIALYATAARILWRRRAAGVTWLLGPAAGGFLAANVIDWPWHLAGAGAVWAAALGGLLINHSAERAL
jgi:O-antigen ligase